MHVLGISLEDIKGINQIHVRHLVGVDHGEGFFNFRAAPHYGADTNAVDHVLVIALVGDVLLALFAVEVEVEEQLLHEAVGVFHQHNLVAQ